MVVRRPHEFLDEPNDLGEGPTFTGLDDSDLEGHDWNASDEARGAKDAVGHPPAPDRLTNGEPAHEWNTDLEPVGARPCAIQPQRGQA